jgi:PAS domain S-box-containing protein
MRLRVTVQPAHVIAVVIPAALTAAIHTLAPYWPEPYPFQFLAVIAASAFLGGTVAGVLASATSTLLLGYLLGELHGGMVMFIALSVILSYLGGNHYRSEAARALSQAKLTATLDAMQDGVAIFDMRGRLVFANDAEASRNGYRDTPAMQQDFAHFAANYQLTTLDGEVLPVDEWPAPQVLRGATLSQWEVRARRRDIDTEWVLSVSGAPVRDRDGTQVLGVVVTRDVTERARAVLALRASAAQEREANSIKDAFLATLSHELRTPLNVILGYSGMLQGTTRDNARLARIATVIHRNSEVLVRIVEDLLDVQRIVAGRLQLEYGIFDLAHTARIAVDSLRPLAAAKGLQIGMQLEPLRIEGDEARVYQVLWNLLSNAVKFTAEGGSVRLRVTRHDEHTAAITVEDTGQGIPSHFLPHVFERFRQLDMSATRRHYGMGLGLAVVNHVAEEHGGRAEVTSAGEGRGASFTVTLPIHRPAAEALEATG